MKITIVGTGYVGLVSGACFAAMGNHVTCVDVDQQKIIRLNKGEIPIYEPKLTQMVAEATVAGTLIFTTQLADALRDSAICFIAVGTPMGEDGSADLQYVLAVAAEIGQAMQQTLVVVNKSTVPVGTADLVRQTIAEGLQKRGIEIAFNVVSNPEFLKEGSAVADFMRPDRVVIGSEDEESLQLMRELYQPFLLNHDRILTMDVKSAEMTKYAANAMLATKISFMNEMSNICDKVGADINAVRNGIGSDARIGYHFIYPGCGYGGSCFPKDVRALIKTAANHGYHTKILESVEAVNAAQKFVLSQKVVAKFGEDLSHKTFAIWGLAFKPETDDMREAAAITVISELVKRGASIRAYDPKARHEAEQCYLKNLPRVTYVESKYDALNDADAMILITEWKEFRSPDFSEMKKRLKNPIIFDGRNQYPEQRMRKEQFEYHQIGRICL